MIKMLTSKKDARKLWEIDIDKPHRWFRAMQESCGQEMSFEEFWQKQYLLIGVFGNRNEIAGGFILERLPGTKTFAVHVAVLHGGCLPDMKKGVIEARDKLFKEKIADRLFLWVTRQNFPMTALARYAGFTRTGLTRTSGAYRGQPFEWVQFLLEYNESC